MQPFENGKIWPSGRCLGIGGAASPFVVAIHVMSLSGFSHPENPLRGSERLSILICNQSRSGAWTPFNPETIRLMIGMFDQDNSGAIEFNEFYALWQYVTDWQRTFRSYDQDNSGTIDRQELKIALTNFGYRLSERMYTILITKFDRSGQGSINFDDFIQCCIILQILTNSFRFRDYTKSGWITIGYEDFLSMVFSLNMSK